MNSNGLKQPEFNHEFVFAWASQSSHEIMDTVNLYGEFLTLFLSLIIAGTGLNLALQKPSNKTYRLGDKDVSRQKVHTAGMLALLGIVIQVVSDSIGALNGKELLLDEKIIGAYAFALAVMIMKK